MHSISMHIKPGWWGCHHIGTEPSTLLGNVQEKCWTRQGGAPCCYRIHLMTQQAITKRLIKTYKNHKFPCFLVKSCYIHVVFTSSVEISMFLGGFSPAYHHRESSPWIISFSTAKDLGIHLNSLAPEGPFRQLQPVLHREIALRNLHLIKAGGCHR